MEVRNSLGWTQEKMAREMLIDRAYLSQIENGRREPSERLIQSMEKLCKTEIPEEEHKPASAPERVPMNFTAMLKEEKRESIKEEPDDDEVSESVRALQHLCGQYFTVPASQRRTILRQITLASSGLRSLTK